VINTSIDGYPQSRHMRRLDFRNLTMSFSLNWVRGAKLDIPDHSNERDDSHDNYSDDHELLTAEVISKFGTRMNRSPRSSCSIRLPAPRIAIAIAVLLLLAVGISIWMPSIQITVQSRKQFPPRCKTF
jgi:hypothetical protein